MILGIETPGTGSHSPYFQSRTRPCGTAMASGVSWVNGAATTSVCTPRCRSASLLNTCEMYCQVSQSLRDSHGGDTAGLNELTKGCMSVVDRSYFSYQVAAGNTMSDNRVELVIRKSSVVSKSSLPIGASSCQVTSRGRCSSAVSSALIVCSAPNKWLRKYSLPLADEPSRLDRQSDSTRGKFSGASGSSAANFSRSAFNSSTT